VWFEAERNGTGLLGIRQSHDAVTIRPGVFESLPDTRRGVVFVVVGFALVLNPPVVGALDIGDPDSYTYEPIEVTFHGNGTYDVPAGTGDIDPEVACFDVPPRRPCVLERAVHANGGFVYDGPPPNFLRHDYQYVHVWESGFFEPVAEELANDTVEYGLEPVPRARALDTVADPSSEVSRGVRIAVETGEYRTSDPLAGAGELVTHDGSYYVVSATSYRTTAGERRDIVVFLQWMAGIGGAWLVLHGQRLRVTGGG